MLLGHYEILLDGKKDEHCRIQSDVNIRDGLSRIEILRDGAVNIYAESEEKLERLKRIAEISLKLASDWVGFGFSRGDLINLETNERVPPRVYGDITVHSVKIDHGIFENVANSLLGANPESLLFLIRSMVLTPQYNEFSVLSALTALELELSEVVPNESLSVAEKLAVLEYLGVLPTSSMEKLKKLNTLRNKLAHGKWKGDELANAISAVLGGPPSQWVRGPGVMSREATYKLVEEVTAAIALLSAPKVKRPSITC